MEDREVAKHRVRANTMLLVYLRVLNSATAPERARTEAWDDYLDAKRRVDLDNQNKL